MAMPKRSKRMPKIGVSAGIDWLSCTIASCQFETVKEKVKEMKIAELGPLDKVPALHGYKQAYKLNGGRLQWGFGNDHAFVHFELTGQGCQSLGGKIWELLDFLKTIKAKFTRLDLAFDFSGASEVLSSMGKDLNAKRFLGFQSWQEVSSVNRGVKATTYYLGSRSSTRFARVYDKGLESGLSDVAGEIVRFEFIFRSEQCQVVARLLLNDQSVVSDLAGLTFNLYRFGSFRRRHKVDEWSNSDWFQSLLSSFAALKLRDMPQCPKNVDFEKYCTWLCEQIVPQLRLLAMENQISVGQVLDTIFYYHQDAFRFSSMPKNRYSSAFKKMLREKEDLWIPSLQ